MTESSSVNGMFELEAMEYERETKIFMRGRREMKLRVIYSGPAEQTLNQGRLLIVRWVLRCERSSGEEVREFISESLEATTSKSLLMKNPDLVRRVA